MKVNIFVFLISLLFIMSCAKQAKKKPVELPEAVSPEVIAENYVSDGIDLYQEDEYDAAIRNWQNALDIISRDPEIHNFVGLAYHKLGKLDSAIIYFENAIRLDSGYYQALNNLGYMYFLQGKYEPARKYFQQSLLVNPYYNQAKLNLMKTDQILEGKIPYDVFELVEKTTEIDSLELKIKNYRTALEIDSNYVDAWNNLGVAYFYSGNMDSAVYCVTQALNKNPDYPPAHNNAGYILDALGEYDKAVAHYQQAIRLRPDYMIAMANLVDTYVHKDDLHSAEIILNTMQKLNPNHYLVKERNREYRKLFHEE